MCTSEPARKVVLRPEESASRWELRSGCPVTSVRGQPDAQWVAYDEAGNLVALSGGVEWGENREAVLRLAARHPVKLGAISLVFAPA